MGLTTSIAYTIVTVAMIVGIFGVNRMPDSPRQRGLRSVLTGALAAWVVILLVTAVRHPK